VGSIKGKAVEISQKLESFYSRIDRQEKEMKELPLNTVIQGDCLEVMKTFPDNSVDCIVTSPPYNKGGKNGNSKTSSWKAMNIKYGDFNDDLPPPLYIQQQMDLIKEMVRVIKPHGSIFYNHKGQSKDNRLVFPEYVFGFNLRQIIIWERSATPQLAPMWWYPTTEYIFWITKSNVLPKFYRKGKFLSEVWRFPAKPMKDHPAPFPEDLVEQCVVSTTDENDVVLDPYMGSGTTAVVARRMKRNYLGIEMNPEYIKLSQERLDKSTDNLF
jgi:modification methylase